ncbi:hypothetical protein BKA82DRAFT_1007669 [Pisolithus tinctorius]|uniref:Uncharacterized protein n=1 Tax=Pisolithus tinctorius Marx 270 TaxID=870435 RepID=A0A0C3NHR6_PISTI|nr:hypothetical protein BKA82DRAFT_1007669 [Pisolithus tinctorius]KIN95240.1 hypothetical protein M404DRAFT_1007669 [Pisolithus tinctorius Marx 270]
MVLSLVASPGTIVYSTTRLIGSEQNIYPKIFPLPTSALPQGVPTPATRSIPTPTIITDIPSLTFAAACTIASVHVRASQRFGARSMRVSPPRG